MATLTTVLTIVALLDLTCAGLNPEMLRENGLLLTFTILSALWVPLIASVGLRFFYAHPRAAYRMLVDSILATSGRATYTPAAPARAASSLHDAMEDLSRNVLESVTSFRIAINDQSNEISQSEDNILSTVLTMVVVILVLLLIYCCCLACAEVVMAREGRIEEPKQESVQENLGQPEMEEVRGSPQTRKPFQAHVDEVPDSPEEDPAQRPQPPSTPEQATSNSAGAPNAPGETPKAPGPSRVHRQPRVDVDDEVQNLGPPTIMPSTNTFQVPDIFGDDTPTASPNTPSNNAFRVPDVFGDDTPEASPATHKPTIISPSATRSHHPPGGDKGKKAVDPRVQQNLDAARLEALIQLGYSRPIALKAVRRLNEDNNRSRDSGVKVPIKGEINAPPPGGSKSAVPLQTATVRSSRTPVVVEDRPWKLKGKTDARTSSNIDQASGRGPYETSDAARTVQNIFNSAEIGKYQRGPCETTDEARFWQSRASGKRPAEESSSIESSEDRPWRLNFSSSKQDQREAGGSPIRSDQTQQNGEGAPSSSHQTREDEAAAQSKSNQTQEDENGAPSSSSQTQEDEAAAQSKPPQTVEELQAQREELQPRMDELLRQIRSNPEGYLDLRTFYSQLTQVFGRPSQLEEEAEIKSHMEEMLELVRTTPGYLDMRTFDLHLSRLLGISSD